MLLITYNIGAVYSFRLSEPKKNHNPCLLKGKEKNVEGIFFLYTVPLKISKIVDSINKLKGHLSVRWIPIHRFLRTRFS